MAGKRSAVSHYNTVERDRVAQTTVAEFARRLQSVMQAKGWNQSELARACDSALPPPTKGQIQNLKFGRDSISHYVRGVSLPRPERLAVIAKALGVAQEDLMPPMGVPAAGRVAYRMEYAGSGRVFLCINRTLTMKTANKINELLQQEDAMNPPDGSGRARNKK